MFFPNMDDLTKKFDSLLAAIQENTAAHKATAAAMEKVATNYANLAKALNQEDE